MSANNEDGLGLFDDAASAVGNFPSALRGYDRTAVDDYVRSLEGAVVKTRRRVAGLEQQVASLTDQLNESVEKQRAQEINFANLGARATEILRLAEEQAREVGERAIQEAERLKELAQRDADRIRQEATRVGTEIKTTGMAEIERLRARGQEDVQQQIEQTRTEGAAVIAAARREAEALQREADHEAQTQRQNAYLDTEKLRREVEREVSEVRQGIATEREAALGHLRAVHEDAVAKTSGLLAEATQHHREAAERLQHDIAEAVRIRGEALTEAEQLKLAAAKEAEERIVAARKQAAAITDRTQQEFTWRKQQLRRETDLLGQRKAAVLNQLASLSALAEQTADSFPDLDDLDDFDGEQGDRTVMLPAALGPALPPRGDSDDQPDAVRQPASADPTSVQPESPQGNPASPDAAGKPDTAPSSQAAVSKETSESDAAGKSASPAGEQGEPPATRVLTAVSDSDAKGDPGGPGQPSEDTAEDDDTMEIDGDATVMIPTSQLPAGTAHLRDGAGQRKGLSLTSAQLPARPVFPRVRQGYQRSSVDAYVDELTERLEALSHENAAQAVEIDRLAASLAELRASHDRLQSATLEERAQDLLDRARATAAATVDEGQRMADELVAEAEHRVEVLDERTRQELAWQRRRLSQERDELAKQRSAMRDQLSSFQALAVDTAAHFPELGELSFADSSADSSPEGIPESLAPDPWAPPAPVSSSAAPLAGRALLDQRWRDLTFLHWRVPADVVAPLLPPGTRPDVFDGSSWVGLIPFRLTEAAFGTGPALPYVGTFPETNVRLYSVDAAGRRGVVFRSLESARLAFVLGARWTLGLNYTWARMRIERRGSVVSYHSRRRWPGPAGASSRVVVSVATEPVVDDPLATFLTARWGLHTARLGRTLYLPNTHSPWPLVRAELLELDDQLLAVAGLPDVARRSPESVLFSSGVRTQFGGPTRISVVA